VKHTFLKAESPAEMFEEVGEAGGPEYNLGYQYSRRAVFTTDDPDMPFCVITETAFVNGMVWTLDDEGEETERRDATVDDLDLPVYDHYKDGDEPYPAGDYIVFFEKEEVNACYCTDEEDPGGTEVTSEYEYHDVGYMWPRSLDEAEQNCRKHIAATDFERDYF
jgi:hypothetical protein